MTVYLQVMWKHLLQASYHQTEEEYDAQMDAVSYYLTEWGKADFIRNEISTTDQNPGYTVNGGAQSVMIKLDISEAQAKMLYEEEQT